MNSSPGWVCRGSVSRGQGQAGRPRRSATALSIGLRPEGFHQAIGQALDAPPLDQQA